MNRFRQLFLLNLFSFVKMKKFENRESYGDLLEVFSIRDKRQARNIFQMNLEIFEYSFPYVKNDKKGCELGLTYRFLTDFTKLFR